MTTHGYSLEDERNKREKEAQDGTDEVLAPRDITNQRFAQKETTPDQPVVKEQPTDPEEETRGREELTTEERTSDPDAAQRGKQPKPSNPEGSMGDEGIT